MRRSSYPHYEFMSHIVHHQQQDAPLMSTVAQHPLSGLRTRRQYLQISSKDVAGRLNVTVTTYNRFERGERRAYLDHAHSIASFLGCTVDDLSRMPSPDEIADLYRRGQERTRDQALSTAAGASAAIEPPSSDAVLGDDASDASDHIVGGTVVVDAHDDDQHDDVDPALIAAWGGNDVSDGDE